MESLSSFETIKNLSLQDYIYSKFKDKYSDYHITIFDNVIMEDIKNLSIGEKLMVKEMYREIIERDGDIWYSYKCTNVVILISKNDIILTQKTKNA